jgi:hypothetical protein
MARPARIELTTHCLEGSCSIQLSYGRNLEYNLPDSRRPASGFGAGSLFEKKYANNCCITGPFS